MTYPYFLMARFIIQLITVLLEEDAKRRIYRRKVFMFLDKPMVHLCLLVEVQLRAY